MQGFAPANEVLLFRQKDPKPFPPVRGPAGSSASTPNKMARELAPLKQPSPKSRFRGYGSAAPEGGETFKKKPSIQTGVWRQTLQNLKSQRLKGFPSPMPGSM